MLGVVIADDIKNSPHDSDGWEDEEGFQEVMSRKTRKEKARQEQEAAAKATLAALHAAESRRKEKSAGAGSKVH